ncbi:hypothetical protein H5410_024837 [Solanum commersonii]|uniref:DUF4283 domain-containing protein n=1 Tax=Solanum commersonii TaxID=4109 RepID=A0A9J5ZN75_SOLCO|nr:hypothetical protein H5410_024837 [Solanum commersonii]
MANRKLELDTQPTMEYRLSSSNLVTIKGTVFLDFTNEDDFKSLWFRRSTEIDGQVMWLEKWTPDFKPEEYSPICSSLGSLTRATFHCHSWNYVNQIVAPGYNQKLENKNVSKFCGYYKLLGHSIIQCRNVEKKEKKGNTAHKKLKLLRRHKNRKTVKTHDEEQAAQSFEETGDQNCENMEWLLE